jgi:peptide/nickel transport system permease protein
MASSTLEFEPAISARARAFGSLRGLPTAWISGGFILSLCFVALFGPALMSNVDPLQISDETLVPPSSRYLLGSDELGRSLLLHMVHGVRVSLTVGLVAALMSTLIGVMVGAVAGFVGGKVDTLVMRVTEIFQVMPTFILAAVIVALAGPGELRIIFVIAMLSWPQTARLIRGEVLRIKQLDFVDAVRCLGASPGRILTFEIVPNALAPVIALSTLTVAQAILLEAALSFFGLSSPEVISWGRILNSGQRFLHQAWWLSVFPGAAIFLTALAFNLFGDCIRTALDPKQAARR